MSHQTHSYKLRITGLGALALAAATLTTTGCGTNAVESGAAPVQIAGTALNGSVHGGQQPVSGATIQLYASSSNGYGAPAYALLTKGITTDGAGGFNITADYTCPSSSSQVYLVATGGNPGAGTNASLAMMAALGACGNLTAATFINLNEITTIASVYALAPFMTGYANVGTSAGNMQGLTNAFATVNKLANITSGSPSGTLPAGATAPVAEINTLANIIASCINTTGASSPQCTMLFSQTTPAGGAAPTDTIGAALNIARNPGNNVSGLLALNSANAPFQPSLNFASDYTVAIKYKPTASAPAATAISQTGDVWVANGGNSTLSKLDATTGAATIYSGGGLSGPSGLAFDQAGNVWVTNRTASTLSVFNSAGTGTAVTLSSGLSSPTDIAIDGTNQLWITNSGNSSLTHVVVNGVAVVSSTSVTGGGVNAPLAVAIDPY